jgi:uncharacterized protein (DUF1778 family)
MARKTKDVNVRLYPDQRELFERAAELEGRVLSDWIRDTLVDAARRCTARRLKDT